MASESKAGDGPPRPAAAAAAPWKATMKKKKRATDDAAFAAWETTAGEIDEWISERGATPSDINNIEDSLHNQLAN